MLALAQLQNLACVCVCVQSLLIARMNARTQRINISSQLWKPYQYADALIATAALAARKCDPVRISQTVLLEILTEIVGKALFGQWLFCIVVAPDFVSVIQIPRRRSIVRFELHILSACRDRNKKSPKYRTERSASE